MKVSSVIYFSTFFKPCAFEGLLPGIGQSDFPAGFTMRMVNAHIFRLAQLDGHVIVHQFIMAEIILDHLAFISESKHEILANPNCE